VASREDVERVASIAREAGALDLSGPKEMPYGPGYYAAFFADPSGNRLEVYVRPPDDD
jgi:catechol 2,3-dioxygenase-like lactoylglutathione lyase family enzyme